jgi:hypothetical protein
VGVQGSGFYCSGLVAWCAVFGGIDHCQDRQSYSAVQDSEQDWTNKADSAAAAAAAAVGFSIE